MKKLLILTFALLLCLMATSALAAEYTYTGVSDTSIVINETGDHTITLAGITLVAEGMEGTYYPSLIIDSPAAEFTVILKDGTTNKLGGISVADGDSVIVIRCESAGENHKCTDACGKLILNTINTPGWNASIGAKDGTAFSGSIVIAGGNIVSEESWTSVGSGRGGNFTGSITITGGNITNEEGGSWHFGSREYVDFTGEVTVANSNISLGELGWSAGIGSGDGGKMSGTVTITDSTVTASGSRGAGIGSGAGGEMSGTITIANSTFTMELGSWGAGIGSGEGGEMSGSITITDSTIAAKSHYGAGIGAGYGGNFTGKLIMRGDVDVTAIGGYWGIGPGHDGPFGEGAEVYVEPVNNVIGVKQGANESSAVNLAGTPYSVKTDLIPLLNGSPYVRTRYNIPEYAATAQTEGGGSVYATPAKGEEGTEVTLTATPAEGYRFVRWEVISGGVTIVDNKFTIGTSDVVVNGIFEKLTYPITWKNYNGDVLKVDPAVPYGDTPSYNGETPTKPADAQYTYTFTGWSPAVSPVTGEAEYTAQFSNGTNTYPITWKNYNGDVLKVDPAVPYGDTPSYDGETPTKPADAQYTYTFTGWSPAIAPVTGEAEYIAQFSNGTNTYPITWKNYNGDVLKVDPAVPYGDTPSYDSETPAKPADAQYTYTFTGWSPAISPVTKEADYIAQFTATLNTYVITWKNYDGTVLEVDETVSYGIIPIYNGTTPARPADSKYTYTFKGWSPAVTAASADCEYTAVYEATVLDIPQTGDETNFVLLAAMAAIGMIGMTVIIRKKNEA